MFETDPKSIEYKHTLSAQRRLVRTDTTERFITALEVEPQGYSHFLNTIVRQRVTLGTTLHPE